MKTTREDPGVNHILMTRTVIGHPLEAAVVAKIGPAPALTRVLPPRNPVPLHVP